MTEWVCERFAYLPNGTLGELFIPELHRQLYTVERPWIANERYVSCIPEGAYTLVAHVGRIMPALRLEHVPGRDAILLHVGNTMKDVQGCFAVGLWWKLNDGVPTVTNSKAAMEYVMDAFSPGDHLLVRTKRAI